MCPYLLGGGFPGEFVKPFTLFLSKERRQFALEMVKALGQWVLGDTSALERQGLASGSPDARQEHRRELRRQSEHDVLP